MTCHQRGRPTWNENLAAFVPGSILPNGMIVAGAANGDMSTAGALQGGAQAAHAILGLKGSMPKLPATEDSPVRLTPF